MRVMLVIGAVSGGGAERQWMLLAEALLAGGHRVVLATLNDLRTPELDALIARGLVWHVIAGRLFRGGAGRPARRAVGLASSIIRLRWAIEMEKPDVVYTALTITNGLGWCATRGGREDRLVWGIRGAVEPYPRFRRAVEGLVGVMAPGVPLAIVNAHRSIELHEARGIRPRAWATVPNGFDTDRFCADPARRAAVRAAWGVGDAPVVGCVARFTPEKEHPLLLRAFARVRRRVPAAILVLAGGGSPQTEHALRELVVTLGLGDSVRFLGPVDDVVGTYAALDVHVLSSSSEGLPNAMGEAMACGLACVGTDVGAVAELIGDTGRVVPPGDEGALGDAISELLEDRPMRTALGQAARARIVEGFSPAAVAQRTLAAFGLRVR